MRWRERIEEAYKSAERRVSVEFHDPAIPAQIAKVEAALGLRFPSSLHELLRESDGVVELLRRGDPSSFFYTPVWACAKIAEENLRIRVVSEGHRPPPPGAPESAPLYFADAGVDGILFAFLVRASGPEDPSVYAYYPIEGEWRLISPSLEAHLHGWQV